MSASLKATARKSHRRQQDREKFHQSRASLNLYALGHHFNVLIVFGKKKTGGVSELGCSAAECCGRALKGEQKDFQVNPVLQPGSLYKSESEVSAGLPSSLAMSNK